AITSMVLGIVGIVFTLTVCGSLTGRVMAVVGVTLGGVALGQYRTAADQEGYGMAKAGVILSIITLALGVLLLMLFWCGIIAGSAGI
ncbi:MAG: DUF4190 domain-containing protein, partial [bacterium]